MNRAEFIYILEKNLSALPADERNEAIRYYNELFDDAGIENEQKKISEFGDPKEISRQILIENNIDPDRKPEISSDSNTKNKTDNSAKIIITIIVLIVTFPIWIGIVCGVFGALFGIFAAIIAVFIALFAVCVAFIAAGVTVLISAPPIGLMMFGLGISIAGLLGLIVKPAFKGIINLISWIIKSISTLSRKFQAKRGHSNE
ncbi:MAG: DUF1700 domain-containing protein [Clostridium sp.]|nr:DUF1700 domain-containing protein [Clostridium sp.]MCM1547753.1 DUF1700 domain-containing protein [Ruminococcus sp.]